MKSGKTETYQEKPKHQSKRFLYRWIECYSSISDPLMFFTLWFSSFYFFEPPCQQQNMGRRHKYCHRHCHRKYCSIAARRRSYGPNIPTSTYIKFVQIQTLVRIRRREISVLCALSWFPSVKDPYATDYGTTNLSEKKFLSTFIL